MESVEAEWRSLMVLAQAGDTAAYHRLLKAITPRLRAFAGRHLGSSFASELEDVLQETLIAIHLHRGRYDSSKPLAPWIYAIARYKLMDVFRRYKRRGVSISIDAVAEFLAAPPAETPGPDHDIEALMTNLPAKQQQVIRLVKLNAVSVREASAHTGMSESDVKVSVHRGIRRLATLAASLVSQ